VDAIRLAESLGQRPRRVIVHTIEARQESPGAPLSAELAQPLDAVLETVRGQLAE
jgi:Ni,Fe-hydrogenase maturation factor